MAAPDTGLKESSPSHTADETGSDPREGFLAAYRWMILARTVEDKLRSLYHAGQIVGGVYLGKGQEAFSVALGIQLDNAHGDIYGPLIRDAAGRLAWGEDLLDGVRTYLGSVKGPMRGRDGNIHRGRPREGMPAMISHLGSTISVVAGMLFAQRMQGKSGFVGGTCIGDGGTSTGAFHEALNLAGIENLPLVVAVANNQYAYSTPNERQFACADLVDRAIGYGITGHSVNGTDLEACLSVFTTAVENARTGGGPQLVVGKLLRLGGHGEHDDALYVAEEARHNEYARDCLEVAREQALERDWASEADLAAWRDEARSLVEEAIATAKKEPAPDPYTEPWHALSTAHLSDQFFED